MALNRGKLGDIQYIGSSAAAIYDNAAATKTYIRGFIIFNGNTGNETVKLYNVPDNGSGGNGTAGVSNQFFEQSLAAKETLELSFQYPIVLSDDGDSIQASTTTASKVTVQVLGDKDA